MGTHGLFGFYYKGKYYLCYNHFDSYPECLGKNLVMEIIVALYYDPYLFKWRALLDNIKLVDPETKPTDQDVKNCRLYTDLTVSNRNKGSFERVLQSGYLVNLCNHDDPPFEEYSYILDLDQNLFNYYIGSELHASYKLQQLPRWE